MYLAKLITVLQSFDDSKVKRAHKYLHSAYFATYPPSVILFDYLSYLHPRFSEKKITVPAIAAHHESLSTLPKQETAATRLLRTLEKFIAQEEWQKDQKEVKRYQLAGLKELHLSEQFEKGIEKELQQLETTYGHDLDTFFQKHLLTELSQTGFKSRLNRTAENKLTPALQTLDEYYAVKKLRYLCEVLNREKILGTLPDVHHISLILKILEPYSNSKFPYVYLFVNVYRMLSATTYEDSDLYYQLIKQFAVEHSEVFQNISGGMGYAVNRSLNWYNKGYDEAGIEYLWWVDWRRKNNLLLDNGQLTPITFRNVITIAAATNKKSEWLEDAISVYAPYLPSEYFETYVAFAKGLLEYKRKQYKKAIRFLLVAQAKEETVFNAIIRMWHWICLYEYDAADTDALLNQLYTFEKFLVRHKTSMAHKTESYKIFIDYATRLVKSTRTEILEIHLFELQNDKHFAGKPWLVNAFVSKSKFKKYGIPVLLR